MKLLAPKEGPQRHWSFDSFFSFTILVAILQYMLHLMIKSGPHFDKITHCVHLNTFMPLVRFYTDFYMAEENSNTVAQSGKRNTHTARVQIISSDNLNDCTVLSAVHFIAGFFSCGRIFAGVKWTSIVSGSGRVRKLSTSTLGNTLSFSDKDICLTSLQCSNPQSSSHFWESPLKLKTTRWFLS